MDIGGEDRFSDLLIGRDGCGQLRGGWSRWVLSGSRAGVVGWGVGWWLTHLWGWQSSENVIAVASIVVGAVIALGLAGAQPWASAEQAPASMQLAAAADWLAQRMLDDWRRQAKERLISTPAPVRVRWQWGPAQLTPSLMDVSTAPVAGTGPPPLPECNPGGPCLDPRGVLLEAGVVTRLYEELYCKLLRLHGRLVLLGEPGTAREGQRNEE
jgi:hypothetical protein